MQKWDFKVATHWVAQNQAVLCQLLAWLVLPSKHVSMANKQNSSCSASVNVGKLIRILPHSWKRQQCPFLAKAKSRVSLLSSKRVISELLLGLKIKPGALH